MIVSIISIGNSKGIRLPKSILKQLNIQDKLELEIQNNSLILTPVLKKPREGWEASLSQMRENQDDTLLIPDTSHSEVFEWEW